ncbi:NAD binding oxidoreductase [Ascobolus immersus RN42]|uniref:D-xylose 1-dehydrogenase (NADP(+), D-xylono-1,5-lactone-forming) n=1 Tax=Ascobolus immersus RN42 TaxID=1160509 RepID=A0A3N4HEG7_ASCIM|nr:NAD binding oxidoreductase [Ascobolus immersus RN42]
MALVTQMITNLHQALTGPYTPPPVKKEPNALRFGLLSTANINRSSILIPAASHPSVIVDAVASRQLDLAKSYAKRHSIPKAYGSYQQLLDDPEIDVVYVSLPNSLHYEWAKKALLADKHVLVEKPFTTTSSEARDLFRLADQKKKVLMEAYHNQFHPASHVVQEIIASGKLGRVIKTTSSMVVPNLAIPANDIRWNYELGGGSILDEGYAVSAPRFFLQGLRPEIVSACARSFKKDGRLDEAMEVDMNVKDRDSRNVECRVMTDLARPYVAGIIPRFWESPVFEATCEKGKITFTNFIMPHVFHSIQVTDENGKTETIKAYEGGPKWKNTGESWWSTYRYQMEALVDKIRGKEPAHWLEGEDTIAEMDTVDAILEKSGLGKRVGKVQPSEETVRIEGEMLRRPDPVAVAA